MLKLKVLGGVALLMGMMLSSGDAVAQGPRRGGSTAELENEVAVLKKLLADAETRLKAARGPDGRGGPKGKFGGPMGKFGDKGGPMGKFGKRGPDGPGEKRGPDFKGKGEPKRPGVPEGKGRPGERRDDVQQQLERIIRDIEALKRQMKR